MINLQGIVGLMRSAENAAAGAVNGLRANSSAADLASANLLMNQYQMIGTLVSAIIKSDSETKTAPARAISA